MYIIFLRHYKENLVKSRIMIVQHDISRVTFPFLLVVMPTTYARLEENPMNLSSTHSVQARVYPDD